MDHLKEVIQNDFSNENESVINNILHEACVRQLSEEDYFQIVDYCVRLLAVGNSNDFKRKSVVTILQKLNLFRKEECNNISLQVIRELISPNIYQPVEILNTSKELITVEVLEDLVAAELSSKLYQILLKLRGKLNLAVLVDIANITRSNPKCLPTTQQHQLFCTEIINQVSSLSIPANNVIVFMQDVMIVASMVQKIWLTSSGDIILPCLANIYTLISDSSCSIPPSRSLAAFLNVTPKSQIEIALKKLFQLTGLSKNDSHVIKLSLVFCDWLLLWPKATQISCWILSLFKHVTLDGRSSIVAEVIALKAPKLMEQSVIPVIRASTALVLPYILFTLRDESSETTDPILKPALNLVTTLQAQQPKDNVSQNLKAELIEGLYVLSDKRPKRTGDKLDEILLQVLSNHPRPNEQRILTKISTIPSLSNSGVSNKLADTVALDSSNWLDTRTLTGKIGLINLGNTCYVNSIIQALYMNDNFTQAVLNFPSVNQQHLLGQLQKVLLFLRYSFRAAYSPATFIKASRPPWFEAGRQQDCSEFLRYLMDSLYEQERANRSVLRCDHRWTVGASKEEVNKVVGQISEVQEDGDTNKSKAELQRWVTEEDLTIGLTQSSENLPVDRCVQIVDSLSNMHSDSTDSGIQSVGDGQEDKEKLCPALKKEDRDEQHQLSLIHKIFGGRMTTTYRCLACGTQSHHQDFFTDLHLAFPDPTTPTTVKVTRQTAKPCDDLSLDSLLKFYFTAEKLQGENRYHCDNCAQLVQEAERVLQVTEAPQHLLLTLLRFHYDRLLHRRGKITTKVSYPQRLELPIDGGKTVGYVLYAVVIHSGITLDGGHYYTLARSSQLNGEDFLNHGRTTEPWFMFNDSQVSRTDFESLISLSHKYPTDTPYLLWYRRVTDDQDSALDKRSSETKISPEDLKRLVDEDNEKFLRERIQTINRPLRTNWTPPKNDDDQDNYQGDSFQDNNGSRFIF